MEKIEFLQNVIGNLQKEEEKEKQKQEEIEAKERQRQEREKADREWRRPYTELKENFYTSLCELGIQICKKEQSQITLDELKVLPEIAKIILDTHAGDICLRW